MRTPLLGPLALLISVAALAAPCPPSGPCALEQARRVLMHKPSSDAFERSGWMHSAEQLVIAADQRSHKERRAIQDWAVHQADLHGIRNEWLCSTIRRLARDSTLDVALELIASIKDTAPGKLSYDGMIANTCRQESYQALAEGFARAGRYQDAEFALSRMAPDGRRTRAQLDLAREQLHAGQTDAARTTVQGITEPYADDAKGILASAAAREGNFSAALDLAASAADPAVLDAALEHVTELQLERGDLDAAVRTVRRRFAELAKRDADDFRSKAFTTAIRLADKGAAAQAMELLERARETAPEQLALVALRLLDHGDFAGAEQLYVRIESLPPEQVGSWERHSIAEGRLRSGMDPAEVLESFPATSNFRLALLSAARELARHRQLQRASELLAFAIDSAMRVSGCTERAEVLCAPLLRSSERHFNCGAGTRSLELCNIAGLQAQLGLLQEAQQLAAKIDLPTARAMVLAEIAKAQFAARQVREGHQTLSRMMQAANTAPLTREGLCVAMRAYSQRMLESPQGADEIPSALLVSAQQFKRVPHAWMSCGDEVLVELASAYANSGRLDAAFQVAELLSQWQRVDAYIRIYRHAPDLAAHKGRH